MPNETIDNLYVDIVEQPINVFIGQDTICPNLTSDMFNVKILEETLKTYQCEEVFQCGIDGFVGSSDIGVLASYFVINEIPSGVKNNINKIYVLAHTPLSNKAVVYLNGLLQAPGLDYTIVGNMITFVKALRPVYDLYVSYIRSN